jgi:hypothetical protein
MAHTRSGKNRPASFICLVDGLGPGEDPDLAGLLVFILDVILQIKKWIAVILNQPPEEDMVSPNLLQICDNALLRSKYKQSIFSKKLAETHQQFYCQGNGWDCGPYSVLNVTAAYQADALYNVNWCEIRNPHDFFKLVLKPFWNVPQGGKKQKKAITKWFKLFWYNFIAPQQKLLPTPLYQADFNEEDFTYVLCLRDGRIATKILWPSISNHLSGGYSPEKAADIAEKITGTEEARKVAIIARDMTVISIFNVEVDPGPMEEVEPASKQKRKLAKKDEGTLEDTDTKDDNNPHKKKLKLKLKVPTEDQAKNETKVLSSPTKCQQKLVEEREERAQKLEEEHK